MIGVSINPTSLTVGKTGTLDHHRATVVGRAVLESDDGNRWHEYYVEIDGGEMIILVYESGVWKWFEAFTPNSEFTAAQAESCRVGSTVDLGGRHAEIRYVSTSAVIYAEGKTWDGVRSGSEARYFNADFHDKMIVVSWTGVEIEFFVGRKLSRFIVPQAFSLSEPPFWRKLLWGGSGSLSTDVDSGGVFVAVVIVVFLVSFVVMMATQDNSPPTIEPPSVTAPPSIQLHPGNQGTLAGDHFMIGERALVEIDEQGMRFQRYEYDLVDDQGAHALLVENLNGNLHEWALLRPLPTTGWFGPTMAATIREGTTLRLGDHEMKVRRLLLSQWLGAATARTLSARPSTLRYGFLAESGNEWLLVRWDEQTLEPQHGRNVAEKVVLAAFGTAGSR